MLSRLEVSQYSSYPLAGSLFPPVIRPPKKPCHSVRSTQVPLPSRAIKPVPQKLRYVADPLFLFFCGVNWHRAKDTASGWELVQTMRFADRGSRAMAAELMAETEKGRLLVRDLRKIRGGLSRIVPFHPTTRQDANSTEAESMNTPYGLQMVENCNTCKLRTKGWYCELPSDLLQTFSAHSHLTTYPGGAILFVAGQMPRGAYVLCSGRVKVSTTSKEGKVLVLKIVEPGEVIGLSAMISGEPYEVTAETIGPCLVNLVEREGLLRLMERSGELGLRSALAVSREFQSAYRDINDFVLARSSSGKLARLLLSWIGGDSSDGRIQTPATHEEMAQRIGASRETVTRLLSEMRKKDWIRLDGATLIVKNRQGLQQMAM